MYEKWKLDWDQEPSWYNWPKWIIIILYHKTRQTRSQHWNLSFIDVRYMITPNIFGRPFKASSSDARINYDLQFSISIIIVLLTSYLKDLNIIWTIYVIGFDRFWVTLYNILDPYFTFVPLFFLFSVEWNSKFAKHHKESTVVECHWVTDYEQYILYIKRETF